MTENPIEVKPPLHAKELAPGQILEFPDRTPGASYIFGRNPTSTDIDTEGFENKNLIHLNGMKNSVSRAHLELIFQDGLDVHNIGQHSLFMQLRSRSAYIEIPFGITQHVPKSEDIRNLTIFFPDSHQLKIHRIDKDGPVSIKYIDPQKS